MRIIEAQEAERAHLAQEIHDGSAQALCNAIFQADYLERLATEQPATRSISFGRRCSTSSGLTGRSRKPWLGFEE